MKLNIAVLMMTLAAGCTSAPQAPEQDMASSEIKPGVYLLMKGTQREMQDLRTLSKAMLLAGNSCAKTSQAPDFIVGAEGELVYLAFECVPGETWPPRK